MQFIAAVCALLCAVVVLVRLFFPLPDLGGILQYGAFYTGAAITRHKRSGIAS